MHQQLTRAYRQWLGQTDLESRNRSKLQKAAAMWRNGKLYLATHQWHSSTQADKEESRAMRKSLAYWRGQQHAAVFYDWRFLCDGRAQQRLRMKAALRRAFMQSYAWAFATWSDAVGAGLARRQALARALGRWENRGLTRAFNVLEERARAARALRSREEAERMALLHAWIAGCAEEIAQRHALLNRWSHSSVLPTPTNHPPSYGPGEFRTPWATSLQPGQPVDTVGDQRADSMLVDTVGDGRPDTIVKLGIRRGASAVSPERLHAPSALTPEAAAADAAAERAEEEISSEVHSLKEWVQSHRWDRTGQVGGAYFASTYCTPASPALTPFS